MIVWLCDTVPCTDCIATVSLFAAGSRQTSRQTDTYSVRPFAAAVLTSWLDHSLWFVDNEQWAVRAMAESCLAGLSELN